MNTIHAQEKREVRSEFFLYFLLVIATLGIGFFSFGSGFRFDILPDVSGDSSLGMMLIKSLRENGLSGIWFNGRIGAPDTSALIDFPVVDNIMAFLLWLISRFTDSVPGVMYTYILLTFPIDAVSMAFLCRKLRMNRAVTFVISCLFALAPYHFYRAFAHDALINYMSVPISVYLSLVILDILPHEKKRSILLCVFLLGIGYGYYYAFGLIMMFAALLMRFMQLERKKDILGKVWILLGVLAVVLLSLTPKIVYSALHGANAVVGRRSFVESEYYGLKIVNLLLPVTYSRFGLFRWITDSYLNSSAPLINENLTASLGLIGAFGFIALCLAFFYSFSRKETNRTGEQRLVDFLCLETLVFLLTACIGGFGEIFNMVVTAQIRCYNRCSVVLTCFSLLMIGVLLSRLASRRRTAALLVSAAVLAVGLADQVCVRSAGWQETSGIVEKQVMYEEFYASAEEALAPGAMVYQLPYIRFPEAGPVNGMSDYKHFLGYLFTDELCWSYGGVIGRNESANELNIDNGMSPAFIDALKAAGFQAVCIDTTGYADLGEEILGFYGTLGSEPLVSGDGTLYLFDISACSAGTPSPTE